MLQSGHTEVQAAFVEGREMSDWEYCTIDVSAMKFGELPGLLAELERLGWEIAPLEPAGAVKSLKLRLRRPVARSPRSLKRSLIAG